MSSIRFFSPCERLVWIKGFFGSGFIEIFHSKGFLLIFSSKEKTSPKSDFFKDSYFLNLDHDLRVFSSPPQLKPICLLLLLLFLSFYITRAHFFLYIMAYWKRLRWKCSSNNWRWMCCCYFYLSSSCCCGGGGFFRVSNIEVVIISVGSSNSRQKTTNNYCISFLSVIPGWGFDFFYRLSSLFSAFISSLAESINILRFFGLLIFFIIFKLCCFRCLSVFSPAKSATKKFELRWRGFFLSH